MITHESNENQATSSFADLYEDSIKTFIEGEIVKGKILAIRRNEALIDINFKSEGILNLEEFSDPASLHVGDEIDVMLESLEGENGMVVLSKRKADHQKIWDELLNNSNEGSLVEGRIFKKVRGGFMVDIGTEAFLPASLVDVKPVKNLDAFLGQTFKFMIVKINHKRKNVVVSRKDFLEKEREEVKSKFLGNLTENQVVKGRVKNITDFGAFIDLGGVDGLLHITDISWGRVSHPSEILSLGDEIQVVVIGIDRDNGKVSLGLKQITASPWEKAEEKYSIGNRVQGVVTNVLPYGAFVELEKGIEGLIHISEFSWTKRINHPSEVVKTGDRVEVMILSVDKESRKLSLGLKQLEDNPWDSIETRFKVGDVVEGKVRNITDYGIFVELEPGIDGLIHASDLSWTRKYASPNEMVKKGDAIKAVLLGIDKESHKIALGHKQLSDDPWTELSNSLVTGTQTQGKIIKIVNFGLFVELDNGLEGLIHISEIPQNLAGTLEKSFSVGSTIDVAVLSVDHDARRIALSLRNQS
ncbi:MAG: 30S ribosomal protein S1 [Candidatus Omnitrophica bacterium CG11_big_fil_rev_8_21_14_0_20_45_26]|uniref:Small ribosomal subunit protein bS1 n=1 Tax=Candidatus Abzuiibacterium crystallinum TaxID=1974748 RepID=A0A2H0LS13_9BACT|nr:MAG: 30S ribosomal protein S1 [Candidatus Omnitrophica bacterium CG11_big_fil_rev_8_21_14_0_20_45_26]PIW64047.1 MAG: 30S ribosomal protein S1 [Candidatus Omnitrophica bacterium CG12_big_fil_rev_8_21_14_0_65_45_16]